MDIVTGTRIDQYEILSRLGEGGMGEVYLAEDHQLGRKVAIKFLPSKFASDKAAKSRLLREARAAATLDHPHICAIYAVSDNGNNNFIVLQYVKGETLRSRLEREPFQPSDALDVAAQIAEALAEAHAHGIIHRDIKPENVMLTARGQVKVLDFGLAKMLPNQDSIEPEAATINMLSTPGIVMGTVPYMSPEQARGELLDQRSDIFSFGVVLYEMLIGKRPFDAKSTAEIMSAILTKETPRLRNSAPSVSGQLDDLVTKCLEKNCDARYQTMYDLIAGLRSIREDYASGSSVRLGRETDQMPTVILTSPAKTPSKFLQRVVLFSIIAVIAAVVLGIYTFSSQWFSSTKTQVTKSSNAAANDLYLRGKVKIGSENKENNDGAIKLLEQAVAADPDFAVAYAELARAYSIKSFYFGTDEQKKQLSEDAEVTVAKALALNPDLAEAHLARGHILWTHMKGFPHEQAIQSFKRAIALNPQLDEAHHQLALVYLHIGLSDKASAELEKTLTINPNNTLARYRVGGVKLQLGKYEEALFVYKSIPPAANPSLWNSSMARALFQLQRTEESAAIVDAYLKTSKDEGGLVTSVKAMLLAKDGKQREAEDAIAHAIEIGRGFGHFHHSAYGIASAYAIMNKPEQAVKWLQEAADDGFPCYPEFEHDSNLNNLRQDERFIAFMSKLKQQWQHYMDTL